MTQPNNAVIVTVQDATPFTIAVKRGALAFLIAALGGAAAVLQVDASADIRHILVGAFIPGAAAFGLRAAEGVFDQGRSSVVAPATRVMDVVPGTDNTAVKP